MRMTAEESNARRRARAQHTRNRDRAMAGVHGNALTAWCARCHGTELRSFPMAELVEHLDAHVLVDALLALAGHPNRLHVPGVWGPCRHG